MRIEEEIFEWEDLNEVELTCLSFSKCRFLVNFGPWIKDEKVDFMTFNFDESTLTEHKNDGTFVKGTKIKLEAISY